ncbi:MAG TPA: SAM-dependent methyltransferase, partial [Bdellovibrionales bacterium]|nr:SAM-dependent methyltransferase [Bdellovibrionales bacterium]
MPKNPLTLYPIGQVVSTRKDAVDDGWDAERAKIVLDLEQFNGEALKGLQDFSHAEIVYYMHAAQKTETGSRHPRGNTAWPRAGIFAQRAKDRPNKIGITVCRILAVDGAELEVAGLDAIDGTPVLDIKPWVR